MAKILKEEDLRLNIIVNGDPARKEIGELTRNIKDAASENKKWRAELKQLRADGGQNKARIDELNAAIKQNNETIKTGEARIKQLRSEMKLTSMTTSELSVRHAELRNAMRNVVPGSPQWKQLKVDLQAVNTRMAQLRAETTSTEGVICGMATRVNKYIGTVAAAFATWMAIVSKADKAIQAYSSLDAAMANAQKTTDMTRKEVEELNVSLGKISTRTAQNELLDMARMGGKLSLAKQDIEGFVRAANIISVSLEKDLGGNVEETIGKLGKLLNVFKVDKEFGIEAAMMKSAAAVNELGKSSVANEANIVEFARRVGNVGSSAKISLANILGLGATMDAAGVTMEVAGTSMAQVITGMWRNTDAFAAAAKMSVKDFKKLMVEDMNEAIVRFAEGLGKDKAGMGPIVAALDDLKLNGQRATGVLTALAENTDLLRVQQEISNKAFVDGTSCLEEYNVMNNTVEANTEKLKKQITAEAAALGELLIPAYQDSLSVSASLVKTVRVLVEWLINSKGAIFGLVAAYITYVGLQKATNFWSKANRVALAQEVLTIKSATTTTKLWIAAQNLLAGSFRAAGVAFKAFLTSIGPIGWIAVAVGGVATAVTYLISKLDAATSAQRTFNEVTKAAADIEDEHGVNLVSKAEKMTQLMRVVEDVTASEDRRMAAIKELQELMPDGINLINAETVANGKAANAVKAYTDQLILQAMIKAALQKREEMIEKAGKDKLEGNDEKVSWFKKGIFYMAAGDGTNGYDPQKAIALQAAENKKTYQANLDKQLADIDKIIEDAQTELESKKLIVPDPVKIDDDGDGKNAFGNPSDKNKKAWSLDKDAAFLEEKKKLRQKYADGEASSEKLYQNELLDIEIAALQARLATHKEKGAAREKLAVLLADKLVEQKKREVQQAEAAENLRIQNMTNATERENAEYERRKKEYAGNAAALEQLAIQHNRKLSVIEFQRATAALKQQEDEYKQSRRIMQERHKAELQTANLTRAERTRLKQQQTNELKAFDEDYLRGVLLQLQDLSGKGIMSFRDLKGVVQSIDLDTELLSEEEKNELLRRINEVTTNIDAAADKLDELGYSFSQNNSKDILGLSQDDWSRFFDNIKNGKFGLDDLGAGLRAMAAAGQMAMNVYSSYDKMMSAKENAALKRDKKNNDAKKKELQKRLDAGLISQEYFTAEQERLDDEYDRKKEEIEIKQAKRQKAMSIINATIATALAVAQALPNLILAGIVGVLGAASIAMIAATPIAGAEEGGLFVERAQDGKKFNARVQPDARGYIDKPTVLVGENGSEYVIPHEAMENPTMTPIINTIEAARRRGQLRDLDFTQVMPAMMRTQGYAGGGFTTSAGASMPTMGDGSQITISAADVGRIIELLQTLCDKADNPVPAIVSLLGKGGFVQTHEAYLKLKRNGQLGG